MPPSDAPPPDLSPQLFSLLLRSVLWLLLAAVVVAVLTWWLGRSRPLAGRRWRGRLFGDRLDNRVEPAARRFLRVCFGLLWIIDGLLQAQPDMPGGFIPQVVAPDADPSWLSDRTQPFVDVWTRHPVAADAVTVWIQVGLGLLILLGGRGILARAVLWLSIVWSVCVWVVGESLGGVLHTGASWLTGAPGAVVVYALAAALLLAPWQWWTSGRCTRLARQGVGVWMLAGAALQALPWEQSWSAAGSSQPFTDGAAVAQPALLRRPIATMASLSASHPVVVNAVLIAVLIIVGIGLLVDRSGTFVVAGLVLCAITWWLGQDFGVLGGTATDPNTALPLGLVLASALPRWSRSRQSRPLPEAASAERTGRLRAAREPWLAGLCALGVGAVLAAPLLVTALLLGPADATAVAADSGGGLVTLGHRAAPQFSLTDQNGHSVTSSSLRGKLILITFLDPVCSDECPIIANQLALADREIGSLAQRVEIVAIDSNPVFHSVGLTCRRLPSSHGLSDLPNWHFLAGPRNGTAEGADRVRRRRSPSPPSA